MLRGWTARSNCVRSSSAERGGSEQRVAELVLEEEVDDGVGEFVGMSGSRALRNQARQAGAVVERLGLIEHGTGKPERLDDLGDGDPST